MTTARELRQAERKIIFGQKMIALHLAEMAKAHWEISVPFDEGDCPPKDVANQRLKSKNGCDARWDLVQEAIAANRRGESGTVAQRAKQVAEECDLAMAEIDGNALTEEILAGQPKTTTIIAGSSAPGSVPHRIRKAFGVELEPEVIVWKN